MRVYISGKITGNPGFQYQFLVKEFELKKKGFDVINPARLSEFLPPLSWEEYMEISKVLISMCDKVIFLKNWKESKGAVIEMGWAKDLGLTIEEE